MIPALISAAVAFIVLATSQWIVHRRERTNTLTTKLEELYVLLLDVGERNGRRFENLFLPIEPLPAAASSAPLPFHETIIADLLERAEMLVEFYFPALRSDLDALHGANRVCVVILVAEPPYRPPLEVNEAAVAFADRARSLRQRILLDRGVLTKALLAELRAKYNRATYG